MSEEQTRLPSLLAANAHFYQVFEALDYPAMAALWEKSGRVFCLHPGWSPLRGVDPVLESWKRIMANTSFIGFELMDVQAHLSGNMGVVTLWELISSQVDQERHSSGAVSTNLFGYHAPSGVWRLFHHHACSATLPEAFKYGPLN